MSRGAKFAVVALVTSLVAAGASLLLGYMWDSALENEDATLIATFLTGMVVGCVAFLGGRAWYDEWTWR